MSEIETAAGGASGRRLLELLVFEVGAEEFALELRSVREVRAGGAGGGEMAVVDLRERLGMPPSRRPQRVVVAAVGGARVVGVLVDRIGEVLYVSAEMVEGAAAVGGARIEPRLLAGVVRVDDRRVGVLSAAGLAQDGEAFGRWAA